MAVNFAIFSGRSDVGNHQDINEDYIAMNEDGFGGEYMFACIADGSGSKQDSFRPASIVCNEILNTITRIYEKNPEMFRSYTSQILEDAVLSANNTLIAFKLGNEKERLGFASTITAVLVRHDGVAYMVHAGNSRMYVIRPPKILQVTEDHTDAQRLLNRGVIDEDEYYTSMERLSLYNGLGISPEPTIQKRNLQLKKNDVLILTTDGIHYSYKPVAFTDILLKTETVDEAASEMIKTAKDLDNFADNISVEIIWYLGEKR